MRSYEALSFVMDKSQQIGLLLGIELDLPVAEKKDGIHILQAGATAGELAVGHLRMFRNNVGICSYVREVGARFISEALNHRHRVRYRVMLSDSVPGVSPNQYRLLAVPPRAWRWTLPPCLGRIGRSLRCGRLRRGRKSC